jgi:hypothetical protein
MAEGGFYVTLPCNASQSVYPNNKISNYRTRLATTINIKGEWEVGLVQIEYPRSWYTFNSNDAVFEINIGPTTTDGEKYTNSLRHGVDVKKTSLSKLRIPIKTGYYDNVPSLVSVINDLVAPQGEFGYDRVKNKVFLKAKPNISMTFHGKLAIILGLKPGVPIGDSILQKTNPEKTNYEKDIVTYAMHQSDIHGGFYTLYIYTDIIRYQSVGDAFVPLLECVQITGDNNSTVSVRYDKPHYASINKSVITDIVIEVKDDQNQHVPFSYGKVCIKLHFRPVKHFV